MRCRFHLGRAALAVLVVAALAAAGFADRETAEFFTDRGEKALKGKDPEDAMAQFRRALEEDPAFLPARFGLARALLAGEDRAAGVAELRDVVSAFDDAKAAKEWRKAKKDAEKLLAEVDATGSELRSIVDAHVTELVGFARKWRKKDEHVAVRALRVALALRPGHPDASKLIEELGHSAKGPPQALFDGSTLEGWVEMGPPLWQVEDGAMVGEIKDSALIGRSAALFEGDFDVSVEMRLIQQHEGPVFFALCPAFDGKDGHYSFGLLKGLYFFEEQVDEDTDRKIAGGSPPHTFDEKEWHKYELRFRGKLVHALVDGKEIGVDDARPDARQGGFIGLKAQNAKVGFRNVLVTPR